jgi:hypothetical protein
MDNVDRNVETNDSPQMKVMGHAGGSRTTAGNQQPNTNFASRADQPTGAMGNAAGFPSTRDASQDQSTADEGSMLNLMTVIQRYPLPAFFIGIGLGYLLFSNRQWR